jgi:hypothetical protein
MIHRYNQAGRPVIHRYNQAGRPVIHRYNQAGRPVIHRYRTPSRAIQSFHIHMYCLYTQKNAVHGTLREWESHAPSMTWSNSPFRSASSANLESLSNHSGSPGLGNTSASAAPLRGCGACWRPPWLVDEGCCMAAWVIWQRIESRTWQSQRVTRTVSVDVMWHGSWHEGGSHRNSILATSAASQPAHENAAHGTLLGSTKWWTESTT